MLLNEIILCEDVRVQLPEDVVVAFEELGALQRGAPESAMLRVQHTMGGGVLNPTVEHVGDLTHRFSHHARYGAVYGRDKIIKTLKWLTNPYGFEREMRENIVNNARHRGVPPQQLKDDVTKTLRQYAKAHAALPVYNRTQWLARAAAVALGNEEFDHARVALSRLQEIASSEESLRQNALKFTKDEHGKLLQFVPGSDMQ